MIRLILLLLLLAVSLQCKDYQQFDYYVVEIEAKKPLDLTDYGLLLDGRLSKFEDTFIYKIPKKMGKNDEEISKILKNKKEISWFSHQKPKRRKIREIEDSIEFKKNPMVFKRDLMEKDSMDFKDPLFQKQWHLINNEKPGSDLNVTGVWQQGITGKNITVCVVDDGVDYNHKDLRDSYIPEASYDFNDHHPYPLPQAASKDRHGTRCAGQIAARPNDICGVGVAYGSNISALRILSGEISSKEEAEALNYALEINDIYSCSWGPADDGMTVEGPDRLVLKSIIHGVLHGRRGNGAIYVFAAGNGRITDNCNYDGYTNSVFTLTIGAIDENHEMPPYMEQCACQMTVAFSSNDRRKIATTDPFGECTEAHGGTSAAAPLAAGIFALALSVRPDLKWRDLQYLCIENAVTFNLQDSSWEKNGVGRFYSHKFGYGKMDSFRLVEAAKVWKSVQPFNNVSSDVKVVNKIIPFNAAGVGDSIKISKYMTEKHIKRLEHVTVTINIRHQRRGDLQINLISPSNTTSVLATIRNNDNSKEGLTNWTFMSVMFWGEEMHGDWTLVVIDQINYDLGGKLVDWKLTLWGESPEESIDSTVLATKYLDTYFHRGMPKSADKPYSLLFYNLGILFIFITALVCILLLATIVFKYSRRVREWISLRFSKLSHKDSTQYASVESKLFDPADYEEEETVELSPVFANRNMSDAI